MTLTILKVAASQAVLSKFEDGRRGGGFDFEVRRG